MKTKIVLTAMVAVIMALAFLPGARAQESAVTEVREQAATAGGIAGALAGIDAAIMGMIPASVLALIAPIWAVVVSAIGTVIGGIWALITPIWAFGLNAIFTIIVTPILAAIVALLTPIWAVIWALLTPIVAVVLSIIGTIGVSIQSVAGTLFGGFLSSIDAIIGDFLTMTLSGIGTILVSIQSVAGTIFGVNLPSILGTVLGGIWAVIPAIPASGLSSLNFAQGWLLAFVTAFLTVVINPLYMYFLASNVLNWGLLILHSAKILFLSLWVPHLVYFVMRVGIFLLDFIPVLGFVHGMLRVARDWISFIHRDVENVIPVL